MCVYVRAHQLGGRLDLATGPSLGENWFSFGVLPNTHGRAVVRARAGRTNLNVSSAGGGRESQGWWGKCGPYIKIG